MGERKGNGTLSEEDESYDEDFDEDEEDFGEEEDTEGNGF